jgi:hypothetical protein
MAMRVGESPGPGARRWLCRFSHERAGRVQACNRPIKAERESFYNSFTPQGSISGRPLAKPHRRVNFLPLPHARTCGSASGGPASYYKPTAGRGLGKPERGEESVRQSELHRRRVGTLGGATRVGWSESTYSVVIAVPVVVLTWSMSDVISILFDL